MKIQRKILCAMLALAGVAAMVQCNGGSSTDGANGASSGGSTNLGNAEVLSNMDDGGMVADAMEAAPMPPPPPPPPVAVVVGPRTEIPANLRPSVRIVSPAPNATVSGTTLDVRLNVRDWPAPQDGRHVHLILDNNPYIRIDNPSEAHRIEGLTPGTHTLRAFPGWSTHESVKRDGAFASVTFHVGRRSNENNPAPRAPMLTYSRPKGAYNGADAERVLLDFYLTNVPALSATGHRVRYVIDGSTTGEMVEWAPHYIVNLQNGEHTIVLDLLGPDGQPVAGPFNHVERRIQVNREGSADGGHGAHGAHGAHAAEAPMGDAGAHGG
ncbi:MAG: hypothetical protein Q8Q09_26185 [Deltaproteobacteria bacterium]|nr:hypothetical protein [Deltaproteobacteria bacterium]